MGGTNPYQDQVEAKLPESPYTITFMPMDSTVEVDPTGLPASGEGKPGSILDIALANGVEIEHACGGVCACSTCHVVLRAGQESCLDASEDEEDMLDSAPGLELTSRLACQTVPDGSRPLVVEIPRWNRNHAKEMPH